MRVRQTPKIFHISQTPRLHFAQEASATHEPLRPNFYPPMQSGAFDNTTQLNRC